MSRQFPGIAFATRKPSSASDESRRRTWELKSLSIRILAKRGNNVGRTVCQWITHEDVELFRVCFIYPPSSAKLHLSCRNNQPTAGSRSSRSEQGAKGRDSTTHGDLMDQTGYYSPEMHPRVGDNSPHPIVFWHSATWNGSVGYKLCAWNPKRGFTLKVEGKESYLISIKVIDSDSGNQENEMAIKRSRRIICGGFWTKLTRRGSWPGACTFSFI